MSYLQSISAKPKKSGPLGGNLFSKKFLIPLIAVAIISILIIIVGSISGSKPKNLDITVRLSDRTANLTKTVDKYTPLLKSSELRGMGSSFSSILKTTSVPLTNSVKNDFAKASKTTLDDIAAEETEYITNVNNTLENARLNAILDRTFAREIAYQIAMLRTLQQDCINNTKNDTLKSSLESSVDSLNNLYEQFMNYSSKTD